MSSLFDRKKIVPRYKIIGYVMVLLGILVLGKALYIATVKRDYWMQVADRLKRDSLPLDPVRGNILSCDGRLMASSLPEYKMYIDFQAMHDSKTDTLWEEKIDSICEGLHEIFPQKSAAAFKHDMEEGRAKLRRTFPVWPRRVSYNTYTEVRQLPIFRLKPYKGGFYTKEFNARQHPFGSLAGRTVGEMYGGKDTAKCGLEQYYDSVLRGKQGWGKRKKVMNKFLSLTEIEPEQGADIVTTIDVNMQDLCERALIDELKEIHGDVGVAIVMEVQTGDVKAIANLSRGSDGEFHELQNHAVSDRLEPGSVFKTASIMVALDDGVVDTTYMVDTGSGIVDMHGAKMRDHNWHRGGYGTISLPRSLEVSSNIGVSKIIDRFYAEQPEKFVDGIRRLGLTEDLHIPIKGASNAVIRRPERDKRGKFTNWYATALPWMSIGYETQVPPIATLTFYNAIANNGRMMRPRFVKQVVKDGKVVQDFPPVVIKEHICKEKTLREIQTILYHVVSQGLGKKAGSPLFKVAGKTGTAQKSKGKAGYKSGQMEYLLSFAGYFPADAPRYSCIVCIQKSGLPASGGGMSGVVFHHIAEGIMAGDLKRKVGDARDSLSILLPDVKSGNMAAADYVLSHLGVSTVEGWNGSYANGNPVWGHAQLTKEAVKIEQTDSIVNGRVPDVKGMGARDAVFLLEKQGLRVRLEGRGKVISQSLPPGHELKNNELCLLKLK